MAGLRPIESRKLHRNRVCFDLGCIFTVEFHQNLRFANALREVTNVQHPLLPCPLLEKKKENVTQSNYGKRRGGAHGGASFFKYAKFPRRTAVHGKVAAYF